MYETSKHFMPQHAEITFTERPPYDPGMIDMVFSKYCTVTVSAEKATSKKGIDVSRRKDAILKSLATGHTNIFGELEYDLMKDKK